jgi:hypothetical protein
MEKSVGVESLTERGVVPAGIVGALAGAIGAVVGGSAVGTAHPEAWGTAGAVLGSAALSLGWCAVCGLAGAVSTALHFRQTAHTVDVPTLHSAVPHA